MPNGIYKLGETPVHVQDGRCVTDPGVLAGSVISLDQAVARMQHFTGIDLPTAGHLASRNPANLLGVSNDLAAGAEATFNVYDSAGERTHTVIRGQMNLARR